MEYEKCLVQLDEILKNLSDEYIKKIPNEILNIIKKNKDVTYNWHYDTSKLLDQQNIDRKTIALLSYLNIEYLLTKEQKFFMEQIHDNNEKIAEKEKSIKYNSNNLFNTINSKQSQTLININELKWYKKILLFLKNKIKK